MMNSSQLYPSSLPESDLELLSAYLDRQLSVAERVNLERRIEAEPALRAELESLRETAAALRALEPLRPPRSFTLDPATAPKPRFYFPIAWVMQLGSGLAGLALVLLATVQMLSVGAVPAGMPAPMAAKEAPTLAATAFPTLEAAAAQAPQESDAAAMREAAPTTATTAPEVSASVLMEPAPMATPQAAPPPAAEAPAADPASTTAPAIPEASPPPAGGTASGPFMNSSPAGGMGAAGGTAEGAVQSTDTSSPDTASLPEAQAEQRGEVELLPGLTLAVGMALIGLGLVWHLYSRRIW